MHDHVADIQKYPTVLRESFYPGRKAVSLLDFIFDVTGQRLQHAVAGAGAKHEVISEITQLMEIENKDFFTFLVLEYEGDITSNFKCIQISPLCVCYGERLPKN